MTHTLICELCHAPTGASTKLADARRCPACNCMTWQYAVEHYDLLRFTPTERLMDTLHELERTETGGRTGMRDEGGGPSFIPHPSALIPPSTSPHPANGTTVP